METNVRLVRPVNETIMRKESQRHRIAHVKACAALARILIFLQQFQCFHTIDIILFHVVNTDFLFKNQRMDNNDVNTVNAPNPDGKVPLKELLPRCNKKANAVKAPSADGIVPIMTEL